MLVSSHISGKVPLYCHECHGIYTKLANGWGLSRERVRQLVNKEVEKYGVTLQEAIHNVIENRSNMEATIDH